ncbi:MAG: hypothetical protein HY048_07785 [Acidobacteria bacterium]|nr:hypothetical protein [Acidobacteriota bacterium]
MFFRYEAQIANLDASTREFDQGTRDAATALADLRSAEQAYVAAGQGVAFWTPKVVEAAARVTDALHQLSDLVRRLRAEGASASLAVARAVDNGAEAGRLEPGEGDVVGVLNQAGAALAAFQKVDVRARDLVQSGQLLTAGDTIFSDGAIAIAAAAHAVELARATESQAAETREAALRQRQTLALGSAAALACLVVLVLLFTTAAPEAPATAGAAAPTPEAVAPPVARASSVLVNAAALATDFGRVRDAQELERLLGRAAEALDASGIVVWMGSPDGTTLQPSLTHGYNPQTIARIQAMPRSADNAAAAAYRSGTLQIVLARPGGGNGAVVAPILSADGCVGVFSAEIRGGAEASQGVQALAGIIAAHLASVVAIAPDVSAVETVEKKVANS